MAFRYHSLGALVASDAVAAQQQLTELFRLYRTREAVAQSLGVDCKTLARWLSKISDLQLQDPRDSAEVPRRGRPKAA